MKRKLKETGNKDIKEIVWDWFVSATAKNLAYLDQCCNRKQKKWLVNYGKTLFNYWKK
jgi:hypothetical protein